MDDLMEEREAADPARAFEDLRAEVSVLRRAVEGLPRAWAENRPPDYSVDLGRIGKTLGVVADRLQAIEKHPALIMTPEEHRRAIVHAGHAVTADAAGKLASAAEGVDRERRQLAALIGVVRTREQQLRVLAIAAGIAFAVGLVLSPLAAGGLPFGLNGRVAALVMHDDRWHVGEALMQAQSPQRWRRPETSPGPIAMHSRPARRRRPTPAGLSAVRSAWRSPTDLSGEPSSQTSLAMSRRLPCAGGGARAI